MEEIFEDARTNSFTIINRSVGSGGVAYNAVISTTFSDEGTIEPVTLQEAKDWCRIDVTDDDTIITALITAARIVCETYVNLSFIQRTVTAKIHNGLGNFNLPYGPVDGDITSFTDSEGTALTDYDLITPYGSDITVVYNAGYETLPANLKQALLSQIAYMYDNRSESKLNGIAKSILNQLRSV